MNKYVKILVIACLVITAFLCGRISIDVKVICGHCGHSITIGDTNCVPGAVLSSNTVPTNIAPTNVISDTK